MSHCCPTFSIPVGASIFLFVGPRIWMPHACAKCQMLNVEAIVVSKMTSHCVGTAEDGERGGQQSRAIEDCSTDERLRQETLCRRQWTDEYVERPETLMRQNAKDGKSATLEKTLTCQIGKQANNQICTSLCSQDQHKSRAIAGTTARCRCGPKFRYVSNFTRRRAVSLPHHDFLVYRVGLLIFATTRAIATPRFARHYSALRGGKVRHKIESVSKHKSAMSSMTDMYLLTDWINRQ